MKTKLMLIISLLGPILFLSCSNSLNEVIDSQSLEENVLSIKEKYPDLDSTKIIVLDDLISLNKGRESYIQAFDKKLKDTELSIEKYLVEEDKFNEIKESVFNYFKAQEITFKKLFIELDTVKSISDRIEKENESIYKQIDDYCKNKQQEIDEKEKKAEAIKVELNQMAEIKIISLNETEYDYRDVIEVKIQMTNKTSKPIEAISFSLDLTDKLGTKIATLNCKSNDRFLKSDIGTWTYDRWDNDDIYKALKNTKITHISSKQSINRLNLGGELISAFDNLDELLINFHYTTPVKLYGHCPYLEKTDELYLRIENQRDKENKLIEKSTPILNKYQDMTDDLLDFSI
jgi:hypothetical protein